MSSFIKALFLAPFTALMALIAALPYLLPVVGLVALHPWVTLSPAQSDAVSALIREFPTRFDWPALTWDIDVVLAGELIVIGFFVCLFLCRIQITALQMLGIPPARKLRALVLPAGRWLVLPGLLFVALGIAAFVIGRGGFADYGLPVARLNTLVNTMSLGGYYAQNSRYLMALFAVLLTLFVLFGLAMVQNSTGIRVRIHMALRDVQGVLILGVIHGALAAVATFYLFQGARLVLPAPYMAQFGTLIYALIVTAILFFSLMSAACAFLLKRQLMKLIAYSDA